MQNGKIYAQADVIALRLYIYNLLFMVAKHNKRKYKSTRSTKKMEEIDGREEREWVDKVVYIILLGCM